VLESIDELRRWMSWARERPTVEDSEKLVRLATARFLLREDLWMLMFLKGEDTLVGGIGLHRIDWRVPRFEMGYWVRTSHCRRGYATEAVTGCSTFAFEVLGARRVEIRCEAGNERSRRVAERAGFTLEGTLRNEARTLEGQLCDMLLFSRVR
jgi:RimJ/RimL family protein N-acetyltransferase